ncbi:MAG: NIPSNAP family protein [Acidobacteria bacterium]|nr:NIPSNAP family protein [Acidobacteriota bacterium]
MKSSQLIFTLAVAVLAATAGWIARGASVQAASKNIYEMRTYTCEPGRLPNLLARFRNHTTKLFEKHGITNVGYWVPAEGPTHENTLVYILAHKDRDAAKKSFDAFRADPEWIKVRTESEASGKIVTKVDSVFMDPTDFSKLQ